MDEDWDAEVGLEVPQAYVPKADLMGSLGKNENCDPCSAWSGDFGSKDRSGFGKDRDNFHSKDGSGFGREREVNEDCAFSNRGRFGGQRGFRGFSNQGKPRGGYRGGRGGRGNGELDDSCSREVEISSDFTGWGRRFGRGEQKENEGRGRAQGYQRIPRGGYRANDEEVFSKTTGSLSSTVEENGEKTGPKVTYVPPPPPEVEDLIFAHYETGINFDKYDDIVVEISGKNVPPAIMNFEEAEFCDSLCKNISKSGYLKPTPVQKYGIPIILAGKDLMACAQTGSGKTAAFLLPLLQHLMQDGVAASRFSEIQEPEIIIVAPTRELISQIYLEARKFAFGTCVRPVVVYGGISTGYTIREVLKGCNVLCGTPGRLLDIIGKGKVGLSKVKHLVLDEADRMLDMGFEQAMRKLVSFPNMPSKDLRQTLMFSATFPEDIQKLAADFLKSDYIFLTVGQVGGACSDVNQVILEVSQFSKRDKLVELLQMTGTERTMVFVETKKKADFIATFLSQENIPTTSIHGDREQREREQALGDFRTGKCPVLVATSLAARGLDIEHVQHVVNFDLPNSIDEYVHRIGRTGRCGNTGRAVSFFDLKCDIPIVRSLVKVLSDARQEVPAWLEEIAFSAHGTTGFNPRGAVFAALDTRKSSSFSKDLGSLNDPMNPSEDTNEDLWE
uniref:RNA helicase n=2 Tax=Erpetoichthys calabaricus TaxID=27687 RepID=A0A8C4S5B7_ERPCA